jgi:predicted RNA-binding Zn-ribbon protein involved in translation (DUF1610 family)
VPDAECDALLATPGGACPGIHFLATLCPECGWELKAARDSLVLPCPNCSAAWEARGGALSRRECARQRVSWSPQIHLPFWRIRAAVTGCKLDSFADLARLANLPVVVAPAWEQEAAAFWIPAFKLHPSHYLRLARGMTLRRTAEGEQLEDGVPTGECHPVSVPAEAAAECVKLVLANLMTPKPAWFPKLPSIGVEAVASGLVYVPFQAAGLELTQPGTAVTLMAALLEFGKNL